MTPQEKVFKLALRQHPLSIGLVLAGIKPMSHCIVKVPKKLALQINNRFKFNPIIQFKGCGYYCYPRYKVSQKNSDIFTNQVLFMVSNDSALTAKLPLLAEHQSSFNFKTGSDVRKAMVLFHKMVYRPHKYTQIYKQDLTTICGISFGFSLKSTLKFSLESLREEMFPQRFGFWVKSEPNLVFVGYPDTVQECKAKIKEWTNFRRTKQFKDILKNLSLKLNPSFA